MADTTFPLPAQTLMGEFPLHQRKQVMGAVCSFHILYARILQAYSDNLLFHDPMLAPEKSPERKHTYSLPRILSHLSVSGIPEPQSEVLF